MPPGKIISPSKQQKVLELSSSGVPLFKIIQETKISRRSIYRIMERGFVLKKKRKNKKMGRPRKIKGAQKKKNVKNC